MSNIGKQTEESEESTYFSTKLKNTLELDGDPVAASITYLPPKELTKWQRKATLCMLIQRARRGLSLYSPSKNIICGGRVHVGIGNSPGWGLEDFLFCKEKLVGSRVAARRMLGLTTVQSSELGKGFVFSPLMKANFYPEVVVFVCTPLQISRILFLDAYETGEINTTHN